MPTRRTVLLALMSPALAFAAPALPKDGLFLGGEAPETPIAYQGAWMHPLDNDNARYRLEMQVQRFPSDEHVFLRRGSLLLRAGSHGGDAQRYSVSFELDRGTAEGLAAWLGVPLRERRALGEGLRGTFRVAGGTTVRVELRNEGAVPVGVILGGRNRGPRDNQFDFQVSRDGRPVPRLEGYDFGGLSVVMLLGPGQSVQREADLSAWAKLDEPGLYQVSCTYEAELVPGQDYPEYPEHSHEFWDASWKGTVELRR